MKFNDERENTKSSPYLYSILATTPSCLSSYTLVSKINEVKINCLLDTGASENFMSAKTAKQAKLLLQDRPSKVSIASNKLKRPGHD